MIDDPNHKDHQTEKQEKGDLFNDALDDGNIERVVDNNSEKLEDEKRIRERLDNAASRREHGDT